MAVHSDRSKAARQLRPGPDAPAASRWPPTVLPRSSWRHPGSGHAVPWAPEHENPQPRGRPWRPGGYREDRHVWVEPEARGGPKPLPLADQSAWPLRRPYRRRQAGGRCGPSRRAHRDSNPSLGCERERPTGARMRGVAQGRPHGADTRTDTAEEGPPPHRRACCGLRTLPDHGRGVAAAGPDLRQASGFRERQEPSSRARRNQHMQGVRIAASKGKL